MYESGSEGAARKSLAAVCYQAAMDLGDAKATSYLGYLYWQGTGVEKNLEKAVALISTAAEAGVAQAQTNLGFMFLRGEGVEPDLKKAELWLGRGAIGGDPGAKKVHPKVRIARLDADLKSSMPEDAQPLLYAAVRNELGIIQKYIDLEADLDLPRNTSNLTALALAVVHGNFEAADLLLQNGSDIDIKLSEGNTLLALTVEDNDLEALKWVMRANADPDIYADDGFTPASSNGMGADRNNSGFG